MAGNSNAAFVRTANLTTTSLQDTVPELLGVGMTVHVLFVCVSWTEGAFVCIVYHERCLRKVGWMDRYGDDEWQGKTDV